MKTFVLTIKTTGSAFCDHDGQPNNTAARDEVASILRIVASKLEAGQSYGSILDHNGNKVGLFDGED